MEIMEFIDFLKIKDPRSIFVNKICKLIYQKHNGNIFMAVSDAEKMGIFDDFETNIRNVYELTDDQVPLVAYYELHKHGAENYDYSEEDYRISIENSVNACHKYYK